MIILMMMMLWDGDDDDDDNDYVVGECAAAQSGLMLGGRPLMRSPPRCNNLPLIFTQNVFVSKF